MNSTLQTPQTLTIPAIGSGATTGTHRMRVTLAYALTPTPCNTGVTYGEIQDYTVTILAYTPTTYTYSQSFTSGATPSAQCTAWTNFLAYLPLRPYTTLRLSGSLDVTGVTVTTSSIITAIVLGLRTSTAYGPITTNGRSWAVGICGSGYEISANGAVCTCTAGYDIRPCIGNLNWGGINGATCSASTQTIIVSFTY